jgi:hypothetical protein
VDDPLPDAASLASALALALTIGAETEAELVAVVAPDPPPTEPPRGIGGIGNFGQPNSWWRRQSAPPVTGDQLRRLGDRLQEFSVALQGLAVHLDDPDADPAFGDAVDEAQRWSSQLWDGAVTPTQALNQVRNLVATLQRFRVNLLLGRPIEQRS